MRPDWRCIMRIDMYTKTILTVIVLLLTVILVKPILQPQTVAAQGILNGVQLCRSEGELMAFDTRTGDIWTYSIAGGRLAYHYRITQLGQPLAQ